MSDDPLSAFARALQGQHCTVQKREHDWAFSFGDRCGIGVSVPWRIIQDGRIAFADSDDGQQFGLAQSIDGEARASALIRGMRVVTLDIDRLTADLHVRLEEETRIDVFNRSSGYEGWHAWYSSGGERVSVVGLGGGDIAFF